MPVLHRLLPRLEHAHAAGRLRGMVTVVPRANPLGIQQFCNGRILGRFHGATSRNFVGHFNEFAALQRPATTFATWQRAIVDLAVDGQIVLYLAIVRKEQPPKPVFSSLGRRCRSHHPPYICSTANGRYVRRPRSLVGRSQTLEARWTAVGCLASSAGISRCETLAVIILWIIAATLSWIWPLSSRSLPTGRCRFNIKALRKLAVPWPGGVR
ncbi:M14 family metallopeptidase [Paraburkholderia polaris]|uniref:hypothetical protein n=1 Tax=Paraburkholderia polaris TaxID=2728848 RepID=UPI001980C482